MRERSLGSAIAGALLQVSDAYRTGSVIVEGARMHLTAVVRDAEQQQFTVHDDGIVDASSQIALLQLLLPEPGSVGIARVRLERDAAALTVAVLEALVQADAAAIEASARIGAAVAALEDAGRAAIPGTVVRSENGEFSWQPDWPATTAATTIGVVAEGTKLGLINAATASGDDIARGIGTRIGPAAAALGTIPAIVNDIDGGMDPTRAIVSESAGSLAGFIFGGLAAEGTAAGIGALCGSVVPGLGTAAGLVVGTAIGGVATWWTSKKIQEEWE